MTFNLKNRLISLCLLFLASTGLVSAQQIEIAHLHFLQRLAAGEERGSIEGKTISQYMLEERIAVLEGDISMLNSLLADTSVLTEVAIVDGKRCATSLYKDGFRVFTISYPANYQLILGVTLMEAEDRLSDAIRATLIPPVENESVSKDVLTQQNNSIIYVKTGSSYIIPELNSNRYYVAIGKIEANDIDTIHDVSNEKGNVDGSFASDTNAIMADGTQSSLLALNEEKECWLVAFFRRIFGRTKPSAKENCFPPDTISFVEDNRQDGFVVEDSLLLVDSVESLEDSLIFELLYSEDMPVESMANLVTGNNIDDSINVDILLVKYGYRTEQFVVPLRQWVAFCIAEGCQPFFGTISQDSTGIVCELIMHNELFGYAHVMKLTFNPEIISLNKGIISARLNSYVPIGNLKSLFDEFNEEK